MQMVEVTNTSQGRVIHIDTTMLAPGQMGYIDPERAKSRPVKAMLADNELKLGKTVDIDESEDGEDPAPKPQASPTPPKPTPKG